MSEPEPQKIRGPPPPRELGSTASSCAPKTVAGAQESSSNDGGRSAQVRGAVEARYPHRFALTVSLMCIAVVASFGGVYFFVEQRLRVVEGGDIVIVQGSGW